MYPGRGQPISNPLFVRGQNDEVVWERTADVLHEHLFEIERENRQLDGAIQIATKYKTGAGLLEPWHRDAANFQERLHGTLQSIRRRATVDIQPAPGGYYVTVQTIKELEDVAAAANYAGGATFLDNSPLQRDLNQVVGQATPSGWIMLGRDLALEEKLLDAIRQAVGQ